LNVTEFGLDRAPYDLALELFNVTDAPNATVREQIEGGFAIARIKAFLYAY